MPFKKYISSLLAGLLICLPIAAQTPSPSPTPSKPTATKEAEAKEKLRQDAVELLRAIAKDAEQMTYANNRVFMESIVASGLWAYDEKAARALFKEAIADANSIFSAPIEETNPRARQELQERRELRLMLVGYLAHNDARMARDFLRSTSQFMAKYDGNATDNPAANYDGDRDIEARLAVEMARNDPEEALDFGREKLKAGLSKSLPEIVASVYPKDSEAAVKFAGELFAKIKTAKLDSDEGAAEAAINLLRIATTLTPGTDTASNKPPVLKESELRELSDLIGAAYLSASSEFSARNLSLDAVMPQIEKYAPARALQIRKKAPAIAEDPSPAAANWKKTQELFQNGTPEALIEAGEKTSEGYQRNEFFRQAALKTLKDGKPDAARQIITEHVSDPLRREAILAEIDQLIVEASAEQGKADEIRQLLARARTDAERIGILLQFAATASKKGDKKLALQLVDDARNLSPNRAKTIEQMGSQLLIAREYANLAPEKSMAMLEVAIDQLNELLAAAILLGGFIGGDEFMYEDEVKLASVITFAYMAIREYTKDLTALSTVDFARMRAAAERFQRSEVRMIARLLVAQSILDPNLDGQDESAPKPTEPNKPKPTEPATTSVDATPTAPPVEEPRN